MILDNFKENLLQVLIATGFEPWLGKANWVEVSKIMEEQPEKLRSQYRTLCKQLLRNGFEIDEYAETLENYTGLGEYTGLVVEEEETNTFERLIEATGVDTELFQVEKGSVWGSLTNMNASFKFQRRMIPTELQADRIIADLKNYTPKKFEYADRIVDSDYMAVISLYDIQLGRLGKFGHAGTEYTVEKYFDVLEQLIQSATTYPLDEIVLVLGNDFADADNMFGTTTKGTPQPQDMHWRYSIDEQCRVARETIDKLRSVAQVRVILVGGNHDMYSNFWLGKYIEAVYENANDVYVDNEKAYRKFYRYGNTSFMFTHGNEERLIALPAIFMKEGGAYYAEAPYNEIHMGHKHQRKDTWQMLTEEYGVYIRVLPSLSPNNDWEDLKGFILHNRAGIAHVYHMHKGQVAEFYGKI